MEINYSKAFKKYIMINISMLGKVIVVIKLFILKTRGKSFMNIMSIIIKLMQVTEFVAEQSLNTGSRGENF